MNLRPQLTSSLGTTFTLERELGGGGMSRIFVAHEMALDRSVVVKVLLPELLHGVSVDRFKREVVVAARLQHPHIVPLLSAGEVDGLPYFCMPLIEGDDSRFPVQSCSLGANHGTFLPRLADLESGPRVAACA